MPLRVCLDLLATDSGRELRDPRMARRCAKCEESFAAGYSLLGSHIALCKPCLGRGQ